MGWQLFEVHDQPWFPDFLRREVLDALQMILERTNAYNPIASRLRVALDRAGAREVLDLFSGAGGPWRSLLERFQAQGAAPVEVFLTDKFPMPPSRTGFSLSRTAAKFESPEPRHAEAARGQTEVCPTDKFPMPPSRTGFSLSRTAAKFESPEPQHAEAARGQTEVCPTDKFPVVPSRTGFSLSRTAANTSNSGVSQSRTAPQIADASEDRAAVLDRPFVPQDKLKPVLPTAESQIHFVAQPLDATEPAAFPPGFRTIFSSFHHFDRAEARRFLVDGAAKGQGIGIFEVASRRAFTILSICAMPLLAWIYTPQRRPFRWSRLLWTYAIPVVPLVLFFDGLISCLRAYSLADLRALTAGLGGAAGDAAQSYEWQIGEERGTRLPLRVTYLIGCPKNSPAQ